MDWKIRGRRFELAEKAEWQDIRSRRVAYEQTLRLKSGSSGRIDLLIDEFDGSQTIIEAKASDWDVMAVHRIRPNALRHARQVMKYVYPYWEQGIDVCASVVYPTPPTSRERRKQIETVLDERGIQVVWFSERSAS